MEILINKSTYTLKSVNSSRRQFFVEKILSNYNYQAEDFDSFLKDIQKSLKENHNQDLTIEEVGKQFFKQYNSNVFASIWDFLTARDKKELKTIDNLDISKGELKKFIEYVSNKIRVYAAYVKSSKNEGVKEDPEVIYAYLSRCYGWTFQYIKEMDELELMKAIENAIVINKRENANNINAQSLAGAYIAGNKKAKNQIDQINREVSAKSDMEAIKKANPGMKAATSRDQIRKIMEANNG